MDKHYFTNDYLPKMHRIGKITGILGVFASFLPALVLGFGHGLWPDLALLATCFITVTTSFGFLWVIEPISYYPVLGPVGTYMAFLSGNISNMRVPCASIAQVSAGVELGSNRAPSSPPLEWAFPLSSTSSFFPLASLPEALFWPCSRPLLPQP